MHYPVKYQIINVRKLAVYSEELFCWKTNFSENWRTACNNFCDRARHNNRLNWFWLWDWSWISSLCNPILTRRQTVRNRLNVIIAQSIFAAILFSRVIRPALGITMLFDCPSVRL